MEQLIAKPLKRFFFSSKQYANRHISEKFSSVHYIVNPEQDNMKMTEIKSIIRIPDKNNGSNNAFKNERNKSVLFDETAEIHTIDSSQSYEHDKYISDLNENEIKSTNLNNTLAERVTVKVIEQPVREVITYLALNNSDRECKSKLAIKETNESIEADNSKKRSPVIKVTVKLSRESCDNTDIEHTRDFSKLEQSSNADDQNSEITAENKCQLEGKNSNLSLELVTEPGVTKHNLENVCIFDENKSRPLSPIPVIPTPSSLHYRAVDELIDFHERQMSRTIGRSASKAPLMGTNALFKRSQESKLALNDSEIISALVRDRFVVNMFESRSYRRSMGKKPSSYGRIYKSLERTVCTDSPSNGEIKQKQNFDNSFHNIISVKQSSPIQLKDQPVSMTLKKIVAPFRNLRKDYSERQSVSQEELQITKDNSKSCQKLEEEAKLSVLSCTSEFPSENLCNSRTEQCSDKITNTSEEINNTIAVSKDKHSVLTGENSYCSETTAEMCSSVSQEADVNVISSNGETEDICSDLSDSKCFVSTSSVSNISEITVEPIVITTEVNKKSMDSIDKILENSVSTDFSYNMEEFLEKALGDELCNYSNLDNTTVMDSKEEIIQNSKSQRILQEDSVCTSDASDLVSKINSIQSNFYRSLTKKLQHMSDTLKFPASEKQEDVKESEDLSSIFPNNEEVTALVQQAAAQYEAMKQITKALTVCRNMKEFCVSSEQVEGERLLLVATYKRQAILDEIRRLDYELDESISSIETGTIMISGVTLPLKDETVEQLPVRREQKHWYVCIFSYGPRVVATKPTLVTPEGYVKFSEEIIFTELPSDFTINLEVYSLLQRRSSRNFSHESKYHINKSTKASHCPTPKKFLQREKLAHKNPACYETGIRTSSFKLCGCLKLRVADLAKPAPWIMRKLPLCSVLKGSVSMNLQGFVQIPIRHAGFLTIGRESGGCTAWNRRWCVVDGPKLRFWNYPSEEDSCDPLQEVDLKNCANARIQTAERSLCARSRTLLLETAQISKCEDKNCTIAKHFLSTDTNLELKTWESKLNTIVTALRTWNVAYF